MFTTKSNWPLITVKNTCKYTIILRRYGTLGKHCIDDNKIKFNSTLINIYLPHYLFQFQ